MKVRFGVAVACALFPALAHAEEFQLGEIVVQTKKPVKPVKHIKQHNTANHGQTSAGQANAEGDGVDGAATGTGESGANASGTGVYVGEADIRENNRETLGQALTLVPGVTFANVGPRNEQTVYVRGFNSVQVPVLIDGVPVAVPYDGYVDLGRFTTFDTGAIEVSKGLSSVIYGPNTMGGVVNLVSRRPDKPFEGEVGGGLSFDAGGLSSYRTYTNVGAMEGNWYGQVSASWLDRDHFALSHDFSPTKLENGGNRENSYNSDGKVSAKIGYAPNKTDEYALTYVNQQGEKGTPQYAGTDPASLKSAKYWQWPYWDRQSLYFTSQTALDEKSDIKLRLYYDQFKNSLIAFSDGTYATQLDNANFPSHYDEDAFGASGVYTVQLDKINTVKLAAHAREDTHREVANTAPQLTMRDFTWSLAAEDTLKLTDKWRFVAGVSYDGRESLRVDKYDSATKTISKWPDSFNDSWTPQAGVYYDLTSKDQLHAGIAEKTRFPTLKDRYSYRLGMALPNPDLAPEESLNYEAGWAHKNRDSRFAATVFYSDISNLIQTVYVTPTVYQLQNVGHAVHQGVELSYERQFSPEWKAGVNYTYLERDNLSSALKLTDTPKHSASGWVQWKPAEKWDLTAGVIADSERISDTAGMRLANGFAVVNVGVGYDITESLRADFRVQNLFDANYAYVEGYPEPGRNFVLNVRYKF
jgi:iron complex outermembrane recepter protein